MITWKWTKDLQFIFGNAKNYHALLILFAITEWREFHICVSLVCPLQFTIVTDHVRLTVWSVDIWSVFVPIIIGHVIWIFFLQFLYESTLKYVLITIYKSDISRTVFELSIFSERTVAWFRGLFSVLNFLWIGFFSNNEYDPTQRKFS